MSEAQFITALFAILGVLMTIVGTLLSQKDKKQQKEIDDLKEDHKKEIEALKSKLEAERLLMWNKYDILRSDFDNFRIKIAAEHYVKDELNSKFDKLEIAFSAGMKEMGEKFDRVSSAFSAFLNEVPRTR